MTIEVDQNDVNEALLDQVRELSGRLARTTAAVKALQREKEGLDQANQGYLSTIMDLNDQLAALRRPTPTE